MSNTNKINDILLKLENHYNEVLNSFKEIDTNSFFEKKETLNAYYKISFYVYFVYSKYETKTIFEEALNYFNKLKNSQEYLNLNREIKNNLKETSKYLLSKKDFIDAIPNIDKNIGEFADPFGYNHLSTRELLDKLQNIEEKKLIDYKTLSGILSQITGEDGNGMICNWKNFNFSEHIEFEEMLAKLYNYANILKFHFEYFNKYIHQKDFKKIKDIYSSINPIEYIGKNTDSRVFEDFILQGKLFESQDEILQSFINVHNSIKLALSDKVTKQGVIKRFIEYIMLFKAEEIRKTTNTKVEKVLQKEFEHFIFLNGYYPISEANLSSGRLDTLAINKEETILYELKQLGFDKLKSTRKKKIDRLLKGINQLNFYHKLLNSYPNLVNTINLIIISKYPIILKKNRIELNDADLNCFVINICEEPPSKQIPEVIDLEYYFKKEG
jgi:hypothetical protein